MLPRYIDVLPRWLRAGHCQWAVRANVCQAPSFAGVPLRTRTVTAVPHAGHRTLVHCAGVAVPSLVGQKRLAVLVHKRAQLLTKPAAEQMCASQAWCAARALTSVLWTTATAVKAAG